ncbi:MAG: hypothetical protein IJP13_05950 [Lachnospiraceae bacterium]|nr:hypothetical protein [Lachnospiraceae bacterium]
MKKLIAICTLCLLLFTSCGEADGETFDTKDINKITIEVINSDEKTVEEISVGSDDVTIIADLLSQAEVVEEKGFVFAEGMYRVKIEYKDKTVYLYPYCGNLSTIRVGHSGSQYIQMENVQLEVFRQAIERYIEITGGIWDWE